MTRRPYVWFGPIRQRWYVSPGSGGRCFERLPGTQEHGYPTAGAANDAARRAIPAEPA